MIEKIISGGQTGADIAALDVAIKLGISHGGWIPKGRKTEAGPLSHKYQLTEMDSTDYRERTKQNIIDSQGTVIISRAELTGGSKLTHSYANVIGKPVCPINLSLTDEYEASMMIKTFVQENQIKILNVAGPRLSQQPWIYSDVKLVLEVALYLLFCDSDHEEVISSYVPQDLVTDKELDSLESAIERLDELMPLKSKTFIAKFSPKDLYMLYFGFKDYITQVAGVSDQNVRLLDSCANAIQQETKVCSVDDAVMVIFQHLKKEYEKKYSLRVVK